MAEEKETDTKQQKLAKELRKKGNVYKRLNLQDLAFENFEQATQLGDTKSRTNLALYYAVGTPKVKRDIAKSKELFKISAGEGDSLATIMLEKLEEFLYPNKVLNSYKDTAKNGNIPAQLAYATLYKRLYPKESDD